MMVGPVFVVAAAEPREPVVLVEYIYKRRKKNIPGARDADASRAPFVVVRCHHDGSRGKRVLTRLGPHLSSLGTLVVVADTFGRVELVKKKPMAVNRRLGPLHGRYGVSGVCWRKKRLNLILINKLGS
jgi:hypothetical protein